MSNVAVVEAFVNALISRDTETALGHLDNDVHVSAPAGLAMGGEYIGKTAFVDFIGKLTSICEIEIDHRRAHRIRARSCSPSSTATRLPGALQQASEPRSMDAFYRHRWQDHRYQRVPERHPRTV